MDKNPIPIAAGVKVSVADRVVDVEGPKGKLSYEHRPEVMVNVDDEAKQVVVKRTGDERSSREFHGLTRALIANMVEGVDQGLREET